MSLTFNPATMLDVKAFGAVGNGVADDSAAIQTAEEAAAQAGKQLYFDPGTYLVDNTLLLHSGDEWVSSGGATLEAAGSNSTVLETSFASSDNLAAPAPVHNILVSGLTIAGNQSLSDPGSATPLVQADRVSYLEFVNDTFASTPRLGVLLSDVDHSEFTGCTFDNIGYTEADGGAPSNDTFGEGVAFSDSTVNQSLDNFVTDCSFSAIGLDAISATEQYDMTVSGNTLSNLNTLSAAFWDGKVDGSAGVYLDNDAGVLIAQNNISGASGNGIDVANTTTLDILNNDVSASGGSGIALYQSDGVNIIRNDITNNNQMQNLFFFQAGITIADHVWDTAGQDSANINIYHNTITDTQSTKTQNWAIQVNMEADPQDVTISTDNSMGGNVMPAGVGTNAIAQAWVQPSNGTVQTAQDVPGGTAWTPTTTDTAAVTVALAQSGTLSETGVQSTPSPALTGTADPFLTVVLTEGSTALGQTTADATGQWSFTPTLADGLQTIDVSEVDALGTVDTASLTFDLANDQAQVVAGVSGQGSLPAPGAIPCFCAGTRIAAHRAFVLVEALRPGDRVRNAAGRLVTVRWVGHRAIEPSDPPGSDAAVPIRFAANALAYGVPRRDVWLSSDHAVFLDGVLIPAHKLVNGATVRRDPRHRPVTYVHVELEHHDILLADGLPAESYLDTGNRGQFDREYGVRLLVQARSADPLRAALEAYAAHGCVPLHLHGEAVESARQHLLGRAEALGWTRTAAPALSVTADGLRLQPISSSGGELAFGIPAGTREVRIRSRSFVPSEMDMLSDERCLGVPIVIRLDGGEPRPEAFASGWHAVEGDNGWRWTDGDGCLLIRQRRHVVRMLIRVMEGGMRYWSPPGDSMLVLRS